MNPKTLSLLAGSFSLLLLSGCMRARIDESREMATAISAHDAIVVLAKPQIEGAGAEGEFIDCVGRRISGRDKSIKVEPNESFTNRLYPWFEPGTVPMRPEGLTSVLAQPGVSEQIAATGVRYIVWLDGLTQRTDGGGSLACGAAPGAAGCVGFGWWESAAEYEATIWDIQQARSAGSVGTEVTGTSAVVGLILPLPFIARVQGTACNRLGEQLRSFLTGTVAGEG